MNRQGVSGVKDHKTNLHNGVSFLPTYTTNPPTNRYQTLPSGTPAYDLNGNLTNDSFHTYAWDSDANLTTLDSATTLTYDALDRRVEKGTSGVYTQTLYGPNGMKLALVNGATVSKVFTPLPGGATAVYTSSGLAYYRHPDWLGSSRLASTPARTVYYDGAYAPYGENYAEAGTTDRNFTGQNQDTASDLYDFLYREYHPTQGRWVQPDPAGLSAVDPRNPQSWNRYGYVLNSPVGTIDPMGLSDFSVTGTACKWWQLWCWLGGNGNASPGGYSGCVAYGTEGCITASQPTRPIDDPSQAGTGPSSGSSGAIDQQLPPNNGPLSQIMKPYCLAVPSGRSSSLSGALGGIGSVTGEVDQVLNYNSGQSSLFATGGMSFEWNGGASATASTGLVYGLDGTNNGFSGPFKGASFYAPTPIPFVSGGGSVISGGGVIVISAGASAALVGRYGGGISATNTSKPLNTGRFTGFFLGDYLGYLARRPCN